jgi:hypothetical protein
LVAKLWGCNFKPSAAQCEPVVLRRQKSIKKHSKTFA